MATVSFTKATQEEQKTPLGIPDWRFLWDGKLHITADETIYNTTTHVFVSTFYIDWQEGIVYSYIPGDLAFSNDEGNTLTNERGEVLIGEGGLVVIAKSEEMKGLFAAAVKSKVQSEPARGLVLEAKHFGKLLHPLIPMHETAKPSRFTYRGLSPIGYYFDDGMRPSMTLSVGDRGDMAGDYILAAGYLKLNKDDGKGMWRAQPDATYFPYRDAVEMVGDGSPGPYWLIPSSYPSDFFDRFRTLADGEKPMSYRLVDKFGLPVAPDGAGICEGRTYFLYRDTVFVYDAMWQGITSSFRTGRDQLRCGTFGNEISLAISDDTLVWSLDCMQTFEPVNDLLTAAPPDGSAARPLTAVIRDFIRNRRDVRMLHLGTESDRKTETVVIVADGAALSFSLGDVHARLTSALVRNDPLKLTKLNLDATPNGQAENASDIFVAYYQRVIRRSGGVVTAWLDYRNIESDFDIYVFRTAG